MANNALIPAIGSAFLVKMFDFRTIAVNDSEKNKKSEIEYDE